jgi:hypothetical protein
MSNQGQVSGDIVAASDGVATASSGEEFPLAISIERPSRSGLLTYRGTVRCKCGLVLRSSSKEFCQVQIVLKRLPTPS